jgi:N-methylhydantoinase B
MAATQSRRAGMAQQGLPHDEPITEVIIPFPAAPQAAAQEPEHEKLTDEERVAFAMRCRCCS